jgi:hypothetical protein
LLSLAAKLPEELGNLQKPPPEEVFTSLGRIKKHCQIMRGAGTAIAFGNFNAMSVQTAPLKKVC